MSKDNRDTSMGGAGDVFQTTRWSNIRDAGTLDEQRRKHSVDNLIGKYWKPVYCYLRRKGYNNEIAKDLTQGFFHEVVLGRELIQQADQAKGRIWAENRLKGGAVFSFEIPLSMDTHTENQPLR